MSEFVRSGLTLGEFDILTEEDKITLRLLERRFAPTFPYNWALQCQWYKNSGFKERVLRHNAQTAISKYVNFISGRTE